MSQSKGKKREYLAYLVPRMTDEQVDSMVSYVQTLQKKSVREKTDAPSKKSGAYDQLMSMIGCDDAKSTIRNMIGAHRMAEIGKKRNHPMKPTYFHAVFTGNPGCNKTTCARLFAKIMYEQGVLRRDKFLELTRGSICGRYQGETAKNVQSIFEKGKGGLIFIDEAYSLVDKSDSCHTYGEEAINELVACLENNPETCVIFAGYPDKMQEFLDSNPGLSSRVPYRVEFKDYTAEELVEITKKIAMDNGFTIAESATEKLKAGYDIARKSASFGNGRFCRTLVSKAITQKGANLGLMAEDFDMEQVEAYSDEEIFSLGDECFEDVYDPQPQDDEPRKIGFVS